MSVLEEAKRISQGGAQARAKGKAPPPLTSLDIHQALKRLLPCSNEPGERLRPYLPAVTKHAWHLDKQSLKGVKKRRREVEELAEGDDGDQAAGPQARENVAAADVAAGAAAAVAAAAAGGGPSV